MGTSTVEQLLENVCLLLASRTRDVVKSALGFIKVAVVVMDVVHLAKHVQLVVSAPLPLRGQPHGLWSASMDLVNFEASKFQTFVYLNTSLCNRSYRSLGKDSCLPSGSEECTRCQAASCDLPLSTPEKQGLCRAKASRQGHPLFYRWRN